MFSSEQMFTINGDNNEALSRVLQLALDLSGCREIKGFYEDVNGLVFCEFKYDKATKYPFKATVPVLVEQINQYIDSLSGEDIVRLAGKEPDIDGTVELGWEVFHPLWYGDSEIEDYDISAVIAVRPCWIIYGK